MKLAFINVLLVSAILSAYPVYVADEVIVNARYEPIPGTTIIDSTELKNKNGRTITEILEENIAGFAVKRKGIVGFGVASAAGTFSIGGFGETPLTTIIVEYDGVPDIMGIFGHPIVDFLEYGGFDRISFEGGSVAGMYGSGAILGRLNMIFPKRDKSGTGGGLELGYNSINRMYGSLKSTGKYERFDWGMSLSGVNYDGDKENDHYGNGNILGRLGFTLTNEFYLEIGGRYGEFDFDDPGPQNGSKGWYNIKRGDGRLKLKYKRDKTEFQFIPFMVKGKNRISDGWQSKDYTLGLKVNSSLPIVQDVPLRVNLQVMKYGGEGENVIKNVDYGKTSDKRGELALALTHSVFQSFLLTTTASLNYSNKFGFFPAPAVALEYHIKNGFEIFAGTGLKFRYPTLKEGEYFSRFGPPGGFKVDPEIKPEKMFDNQFGASFSSRLFFIKLEFHYRNVKDMIGVKGSFPNLVQSNLTEYEGYGSGIIYKLIPINGLELNGNVSQEIKKKGILIGPEASINLGIKYTFYGVTTKLKCGYLKNPGQTDAPLPDVFTVDWDVSYSFKKLGFYLEGNNLLDREYELIKGYKMPGRNFGGGIRVEF